MREHERARGDAERDRNDVQRHDRKREQSEHAQRIAFG